MEGVLAFEKLSEADLEALVEEERAAGREAVIACAACRALVTTGRERIARSGAHEHRFTNPYGIEFRIGCFGDAPGCALSGPPTEAWTWFAGYAWRFAHCRGCAAHLGWGYSPAGGDGAGFYGLILDRLVTVEEGAA